MSQFTDTMRRAALILCSYAAFFLAYGLAFRTPYHENGLILAFSATVLMLGIASARWWIVFLGCLALTLFNTLLTWLVGQMVGLDDHASASQLFERALLMGTTLGVLYSLLAWRIRVRSAGASPADSGAPAA